MSIQHIGILGSGTMGRGIVELLVANGYKISWVGSNQSRLNDSFDYVKKRIDKLISRNKIDIDGKAEDYISTSTEISDFSQCDMVIEAVEEAPGFIVNRMLIPMIKEAVNIFADGIVSAEDIINAIKHGAKHHISSIALSNPIDNDVNL